MTIRSNLYSDFPLENAALSGDYTSDTNGSAIDLRDATEQVFLASVGAPTTQPDTTNKLELEVQESDDNSTWTAAADADVRGAVSGSNTGTFAVLDATAKTSSVYKAGYIGDANYVRVVVNASGSVNAIPLGVISFKKENQRPVQ